MSSIGVPGLIILVILALILFGPKKLPELGRAFGQTLREFKKATHNLANDDEDDAKPAAANNTKALTTNENTTTGNTTAKAESADREAIEREIRERLERERLEAEIRVKLEQERVETASAEQEKQKA